MEKKLSVLERLVALTLLPKEGKFTDLKLIREARENLSFTEEEYLALKFREEGGRTLWNDVVGEKDIKINSVAVGKLIEALRKLDSDGKLVEEHMSLYEKFVEGE